MGSEVVAELVAVEYTEPVGLLESYSVMLAIVWTDGPLLSVLIDPGLLLRLPDLTPILEDNEKPNSNKTTHD